ncbi:DUF3995 domain-containing protein [Kitasatospora sp. NPDC018058]|uniref:DUF3995 domain-containing protein n=1 Tax=Kitasatospora sp. NPDC018058 TaxID=3364025 RepID=UPI0037BE365A
MDIHARARAGLPRIAAYAAATWSAAFSAVHLYWLLGGRLGLPDGLSVLGNTPLLVIDILAIPLCALAAVLALALVRPWGARLPARPLAVALWGTTALLLVHAAPSVSDWAALAFGSRTTSDFDAMGRFATLLYEPFFMTGGLLFALAALGRRRPGRA